MFVCSSLLVTSGHASAAQLVISPVTIELGPSARSATIDLTNRADDPIRLEISALDWDMDASGNAPATPASDIVVYPQFVTIPAHGTRRVRAASLLSSGSPIERAYRVSLAEIPIFGGASTKPGVNLTFRTTYLLGAYLAPDSIHRDAAIVAAGVARRTIAFRIENRGNVHEVLKNLTITALGAAGRVAFTKAIDPAIVLAGRTRSFEIPLTASECASMKAMTISTTTGAGTLTKTIDAAGGDCEP